ncbi:MAG TPA: hypothetical protein VMV94_00515 [Phycisphaerae bacterium]|nr:hypothetical protein [Phycisphaerae bacterium]
METHDKTNGGGDAPLSGTIPGRTARCVGFAGVLGVIVAVAVWTVPMIREAQQRADGLLHPTVVAPSFDYVCAIATCAAMGCTLLGFRQAAVAEVQRKPRAWWCLAYAASAVGFSAILLGVHWKVADLLRQTGEGSSAGSLGINLPWVAQAGIALMLLGGVALYFDAGRLWVTRRAERARAQKDESV